MITPLIVVIISQYIQILNHDVVHLKLLQSYMSIVSQLKGFPGSSVSKEPACKAGDCLQYKRPSSIPGSGSSPGEENGNPLQYSCLENSMDRGTWWAIGHGLAKSQKNLWKALDRWEQWMLDQTPSNGPGMTPLCHLFHHQEGRTREGTPEAAMSKNTSLQA